MPFPATARRAWIPYVLLGFGVACVSTAGLIARRALFEATPLSVAAWRLGIASVFFLALTGTRSAGRAAQGKPARAPLLSSERARLGLGGLFLCLHFLTWFGSLRYTGVSIATLLTCTTPLWTALGGLVLKRDRADAGFWGSLVLAFAGIALVVHPGGAEISRTALLGDFLATLGGITFTGYLFAVDGLQHIASERIVTTTYSVAALLLWGMLLALGGATLAYSAPVWQALLLLAIVPQIFGHTLLNNALRHFPANTVAFSVLAEPVVTAALAHYLLREVLLPIQIGGGVLVLAALGIVLARGTRRAPVVAEDL